MLIRKAEPGDLAVITEIYNQAILHTVATFDTETKTIASRQEWFDKHDDRYPILVMTINGLLVAWASLSLWSDKYAYNQTAELSIYVAEDHQGQGIGKKLMKAIIDHARNVDCHTIISRVTAGNETSIYLHEKYGFELIGTMKEAGYKFGDYLDIHFYQLLFK